MQSNVPTREDNNIPVPRVVVGIVVERNGEILITRSKNWKNKWVIVGGHLEYGETLAECAAREVKEETSLSIVNIRFLENQESIDSPEFDGPRHFVFINHVASALPGKVVLDSESVEYRWLSPEDALAIDLNQSSRRAIESYREFVRDT